MDEAPRARALDPAPLPTDVRRGTGGRGVVGDRACICPRPAQLTDLYEVTMALSYLREGMTAPATFSLSARRLPALRGFLVAAGLERCLDLLSSFRVEDEDVAAYASALGRPVDDLRALHGLRFTGDVWAVPEGRVIGADEPLLEVTAPLPEAQLVETMLLNATTFATAIAAKAARCVLAARGRPVVDFALRRTHGAQAGIEVARLTAMVGFAGTSNVAAAAAYGLPAVGTMAHSYIEAFGSEQAAFDAFASAHPGPVVLLVDTYDTLAGVRTAARTIRDLGLPRTCGVRLDSGDLAVLARRAREILDAAGLPATRIVVSGGLDELAVDDSSGSVLRSTSSPSAPRSACPPTPLAGHGVQARRARRPGDDEVVRGQGDLARREAGAPEARCTGRAVPARRGPRRCP